MLTTSDYDASRHGTGATKAQSLNKFVGKRIREERVKSHLTLKELAKRAHTTPQTISRLETGGMTISIEWLERLASLLEREPWFFLGAPSELHDLQGQIRLIDSARKDMCASVLTYHTQLIEILNDYSTAVKKLQDRIIKSHD